MMMSLKKKEENVVVNVRETVRTCFLYDMEKRTANYFLLKSEREVKRKRILYNTVSSNDEVRGRDCKETKKLFPWAATQDVGGSTCCRVGGGGRLNNNNIFIIT